MAASVKHPDRSILIVDDDPDVRVALAQALKAGGFSVLSASHGLDALRVLRTRTSVVDVILLDLMMPVMNGWQFCREQQQDPNLSAIPVLVLSAGNHVAEAAASIGASGYLRKPVDLEELWSAVERVCSGAKRAGGA
jgi:CheY-like chemotaxis protein